MFARTYLEVNPGAKLVIFDYAKSIGGVWATERDYPGLKTNNMLGTYEYPDFPMDTETYGVQPGEFIPGRVVHKYLADFANKFRLGNLIRFDSKVVSANKGEDDWDLSVASGEEELQVYSRKLVLATGNTSEPFLPAFNGLEKFEAPVFHVKELGQRIISLQSVKEVAVIGGTKSAWDAAYAFSQQESNEVVHMIIRKSGHGPVWMTPPYVTPLHRWLEKLVHTRFLTFFSPCVWGMHDGYHKTRDFLHGTGLGRWIVDQFWTILADDVRTLNGYSRHPETKKLDPWSNPMFLGSGLSILNYDQDFFGLVRDGKVKIHIADPESMDGSRVHLSSGEELEVDAVVCSTGWKHHPPLKLSPGSDADFGLPYASSEESIRDEYAEVDREILSTFPRLVNQPVQNPNMVSPPYSSTDANAPPRLNNPYKLYKFMVPPSLCADRTFGLVGVPSTITTSTIATIQALWMTAYLSHELELPEDVEYEAALHSRFGRWRYPPDTVHSTPTLSLMRSPTAICYSNSLVSKVIAKVAPLQSCSTHMAPRTIAG